MIKLGDIISLESGHTVYTEMPKHYAYSNREGDWSLVKAQLTLGDDETFNYLMGEYVVYKTTVDGGGKGSRPGDDWPDGHHVFAVKKNNSRVRVDFYQSGSFTAMITDIEPTGKIDLLELISKQ